jgi:hypothetical protein
MSDPKADAEGFFQPKPTPESRILRLAREKAEREKDKAD